MRRFAACSLFVFLLACDAETIATPGPLAGDAGAADGAEDGGANMRLPLPGADGAAGTLGGAGGMQTDAMGAGGAGGAPTAATGGVMGTVGGTGGAASGGSGGTDGGPPRPDTAAPPDAKPPVADGPPITDGQTFPWCLDADKQTGGVACARVDQYRQVEWQRKNGYRCATCLRLRPTSPITEHIGGCIKPVPKPLPDEQNQDGTPILCVLDCNECSF